MWSLILLVIIIFTFDKETKSFGPSPVKMNKINKQLSNISRLRTVCINERQFKTKLFLFCKPSIPANLSCFKNFYSHRHFYFSTSTYDPLQNLTFQQLIQLKSTQSLTKAAQIMAQLQIQHQNIDSQIIKLQQQLSQFPQENRALMERIKSMADNVKLQESQNTEIEKRAQKELEDAKKYAISKVAKEVLQVSDNLERSIKHSQKIEICLQTHSQVKRFHKQLQVVFKRFGIEQFDPVGKEYDPNSQQSMVKVPVPKNMTEQQKVKKSNTVVECFRTGYMIKGRLLRSAHVVVYE